MNESENVPMNESENLQDSVLQEPTDEQRLKQDEEDVIKWMENLMDTDGWTA